ncbi:MAG TPA: hypothetical protein DCM28_07320 [Phycisphaerales bacterium]|nr:hypothetical protein [Phycisphaerales bacterium]HCD31482.1 hypothetical protein [Phycisphaerales bacterium]|tara:strand:+ start:595 stop:1383 length:789 start_codon:yes stop_codon:yes gene_type:complete
MGLHLIKLGGSVITRPGCDNKFYAENMQRIARELLATHEPIILVHGTGHVGKPPAIEHGYADTGIIPASNTALSVSVRRDLQRLNEHVVQTLLDVGHKVLPLDTGRYFNADGSDLTQTGSARTLEQLTASGIIPIFHGDMVQLRDGAFKVVSSDAIMSVLARYLMPDAVYLLTDVDGVYSDLQNGQLIQKFTPVSLDQMQNYDTDDLDVSGGMRAKVQHALAMAAHCQRCVIASGLREGVITRLLTGQDERCTIVDSSDAIV